MKKSLPIFLILNFLISNFLISPVHASDELYFLHQDHLGSTRAVTDRDGNVVARYDYYLYGSLKGQTPEFSGSDPGVERLYTSQIYDSDSYLYFYNSRYYDPSLGIFISPDPIQGPNRYAYVAGNPINIIDPSGNMLIADGGGGRGGGGNWLDEYTITPYIPEAEIGATMPVGGITHWEPFPQEVDPSFYKLLGGVAAFSIAAPLAVASAPAATSWFLMDPFGKTGAVVCAASAAWNLGRAYEAAREENYVQAALLTGLAAFSGVNAWALNQQAGIFFPEKKETETLVAGVPRHGKGAIQVHVKIGALRAYGIEGPHPSLSNARQYLQAVGRDLQEIKNMYPERHIEGVTSLGVPRGTAVGVESLDPVFRSYHWIIQWFTRMAYQGRLISPGSVPATRRYIFQE